MSQIQAHYLLRVLYKEQEEGEKWLYKYLYVRMANDSVTKVINFLLY